MAKTSIPSMDYELAALKLFSSHLRAAKQELHTLSLFGIRFQRAWLQVTNHLHNPSLLFSRLFFQYLPLTFTSCKRQGVLISGSEKGRFLLDDGTDVVELTGPVVRQSDWKPGLLLPSSSLYYFCLCLWFSRY